MIGESEFLEPRESLTRRPVLRRPTADLFAAGLAAVCLFLLTSCSDNDDQLSKEDLLAEIEGRELTEAEVEERDEIANLLCTISDDVLVEIWDRLTPERLAFQDYVFGRVCPDRNDLYGQTTGRFTNGDTKEP